MSDDKRTVTTDALTTLGMIIDATQKRDAIHLAVEPVKAGATLKPGEHIRIVAGVAYSATMGGGMGIVDPFLAGPVEEGQWFWFIMYPRQVRSLRHVWSHPDFPDEVLEPGEPTSKQVSEQWLMAWCANEGGAPPYHALLESAWIHAEAHNAESGHPESFHIGADAHGEVPEAVWVHLERVTGRRLARAAFFTCGC